MNSHQLQQLDQLPGLLLELWQGARSDPFAFDLAIVPSAGFQRWLSQQLALSGGAEGICAGVDFATFTDLESRLHGPADPWLPRRLAWRIAQLAEGSADPELEVLQRHLAASRQNYSSSLRIARQLRRYARYRPALLEAWQAGADTDTQGRPLGASRWQAHLYRALVAELGSDPVQDRVALLTRLRQAPVPELPARLAVLAPQRIDQSRLELLAAIARQHQVDLITWQPSAVRAAAAARPGLPAELQLRRPELSRPPGHPLNEALAALSDELAVLAPGIVVPAPLRRRDSLLAWLQADLAADSPPAQPRALKPADTSVQLHLSHGPDRQVEVLREVLTQTFALDRSLEPRDIVVLTPALDTFAPLLKAAFTKAPGLPSHPAHSFRLQLADRVVAQVNPLAQLLLDLLQLPLARLEASTLLEFCARTEVSRRFGFRPDAQQRLAELVNRAGIKWGLSGAQRAEFGLGDFPQNTWIAGLLRMLLGVALPETEQVSVGTVLPLDDVESSDLELIGGLTELIGRLSRLLQEFEQPVSAQNWAERCQRALQDLIELPAGEEWQLSDIWATLARLAESSATSLSRAAVAGALRQDFESSRARGAYGNGNLLVAGLDSLRGVPHRVVVLLGWDAECYPRPGRPHGDDLVGAEPLIGEANASLEDRQQLLDAIHSARDTLIVIARGRSETTNEAVPLAAPLVELEEALDLTAAANTDDHRASRAVRVLHPLQPFDRRYFEPSGPLVSADRIALAAARALLEEPTGARDRFRLLPLDEPDLSGGVALDDLVAFFVHPAKSLLRTRAGLNLAPADDPADLIPIDPDGLARWQIGNRVLQRLRDGADPDSVAHAEWLRGEVPPFQLGQRMLDQIFADARSSARLAPNDPAAIRAHDLTVPIQLPGTDPVTLTGRVNTQSDEVLQVEYSRLQAKHLITAWLRLLALAAAEPGAWRARVIGRGRTARYAAPPAAVARELLARYLQLFRLGLGQPLPALPRLGLAWAEYRASHRDPQDRMVSGKVFERCWEFDSDAHWRAFFSYPELLSLGVEELAIPGLATAESTLVGALAQSIWAPVLAGEVLG